MFDENGNFFKPDRGSAPEPDHIMISFSDDPHTTMTVTWRTNTDVTCGYILYREEGSSEINRLDAVHKTLESDIDISNFFWVTPRNLKPGTRYLYTVGSQKHRSEEFSFTTEPENLTNFKFLLIADHQKSSPWTQPDYSVVNALIKKALKKYPDCRFILTAGDNCDNGQNEIQWNGMFSGLEGIVESIPYMMCTGNHDNRGYVSYLPKPVGKFYLDHTDFFDSQFELSYPQNGPKGYQTENYSFEYGNAHFLIMGINAPEIVEDWAYNDLKNSNKTWKLGAYHFPIYPLMPEGQNDDGYPWLRKPIEQGRLDILFAGHEHSFARTYPILNEELFDKPSQGVVHYIMGNSGRNIYCSNARKIWHSTFYPQEEDVAMISVVEINENKLTITALLDDGRIADIFTLDKDRDIIEPIALAPIYKNTKISFKGQMIEFTGRGIYAKNVDGKWFVPFGVVVQFMGGAVTKTKGKVSVEAYETTAVFTEGSDIVETDEGVYKLSAKVFRGDKEQLYMPAEDCAKIFDLGWQYAKRNNFINFDHFSENYVTSKQP